jgi:hypothetical protein
MADFSTFKDIYSFTSPKDLLGAATGTSKSTDKQTLLNLLMDLLLNPHGRFKAYEEIKKEINNRFTNDAVEKDLARGLLHAVSTAAINPNIDFSDGDYWKKGPPGANKPFDLRALLPDSNLDSIPVSVFVSKSPYLNPGRRGTDAVEMFLNYIPSVMASRMVPYLEVEFQLASPPVATGKKLGLLPFSVYGTNTPSLLRFLVGSAAEGDEDLPVTDGDLALRQVRSPIAGEKQGQQIAYSGMEMFTAPQTLSPMDYLKSSNTRLVDTKPFLPFASVEDFSVQIMNAGAGAMAHKKGSMKLKIHDKSRLAEISEFIKGPSGFGQAVIWTTYGWLAPRTTDSMDEYAKFINENMMVTECWQVANTQFSFDLSGQVSLTLEMVSKGVTTLQKTSIDKGSEVSKRQENLRLAMETIQRLRLKLPSDASNSLGVEVRSEQILNAASRGEFPDFDPAKVSDPIGPLVTSLRSSGRLTDKEADELAKYLTFIKDYKKKMSDDAGNQVIKVLQRVSNAEIPDCFLANDERVLSADGKTGYFTPDLVNIVKVFNESLNAAASAAANQKKQQGQQSSQSKPKEDPIKLDGIAPVMSFGKLFTSIVVPAILSQRTCDELQVIFYCLNDQCGPVSGHSVAEFPIDMKMLAYSFRDLLKTGTSPGTLTIEEFLRMIVNSQFSDNRAIGYGMFRAFEPFNPDDRAAKNVEEKEYEARMTEWLSQYGTLQRPVIEMYVESGMSSGDGTPPDVYSRLEKSQLFQFIEANATTAGNPDSTNKIIKRIHVYDKQNNPYKLINQVISTGEGTWTIGQIDVAKVRAHIAAAKGAKPDLADDDIRKRLTEEGVVADFIRRPAGEEILIGAGENKRAIRDVVKHMAPNIVIGTNGSMVKTANLASKTDGLMGAINIINSNKGSTGGSGAAKVGTGLEGPNGLPLRVVPAQLTMTSFGVPIAQLYQQYFIDFGTGTTIDNLYNCTQIQHTIGPGKFETSWTFAYTDGYGKFGGAQSMSSVVTGELKKMAEEAKKKAEEDAKKNKGKTPGKK